MPVGPGGSDATSEVPAVVDGKYARKATAADLFKGVRKKSDLAEDLFGVPAAKPDHAAIQRQIEKHVAEVKAGEEGRDLGRLIGEARKVSDQKEVEWLNKEQEVLAAHEKGLREVRAKTAVDLVEKFRGRPMGMSKPVDNKK